MAPSRVAAFRTGSDGIIWQPVLLIKSSALRDVKDCCVHMGISFAFVTRFTSTSIWGFWHLFRALSAQLNTDSLANRAIVHTSPHLMVGRKSKRSEIIVRSIVWPFSIPLFDRRNVVVDVNIPIVMFVDESLHRDSPIAPFWVRSKLMSVETKAVSLIALNAYISTLGGGHYLCKHIEDAWNMALRQQAIAIALGDPELAGQCRIHLAYICMQLGKLKSAQRRLRREKVFAEMIESNKLLAVVNAAQIYLNKLVTRQNDLKHKAEDKLRDSFYRQRFVEVKMKTRAT